ncbi:MAG: pyridoxal 5'-phosphate synthase glutaminase subunit PdxT [Solirubrobacterales bacterium]
MAGQALRIGVLASQGDFEAHCRMLAALGAETSEVRLPGDLEELDGLVIPGGESTTISKALARDGLDEAIRSYAGAGGAILGTCAGMIVLDREHLGLLDVRAERNAFVRQRQSFEQDLEVEGLGPDPLRAVFIRAPWVGEHGDRVEVLASHDRHPVVVRESAILACSFHPEITDDSRLHALFMAIADSARNKRAASALPN